MLIVARVVQGLGAAMITPQTMAIITRIFPADRRGGAMALWGATAGVATLVGPILGGVLVDGLGWEWIFFINIPVGIVGFVLALAAGADAADPHATSSTGSGVALSGVGMFLLVFGIQEGHQYDWGRSPADHRLGADRRRARGARPLRCWQARNKREPLVPLSCSATATSRLANVAISAMGFAITALALPDHALRPAGARAEPDPVPRCCWCRWRVMSIVLAPLVGKLTDRVHPRADHRLRLRLPRGRPAVG